MSQRNNFGSGFWLGAALGGAVGGIIGALVATRATSEDEQISEPVLEPLEGEASKPPASDGVQRRLRSRRRLDEVRMDNARRSLEGRIAQLNEAIDDVRQQFEDSEMR